MHCHCSTNNRAPRWTFTDPCKPETRQGAREESASPAWPAAPAMNARDTTKVYIWMLDTGCGPTLYRNCHSHNTPGKKHNNSSGKVLPLAQILYYGTTLLHHPRGWCTDVITPTGSELCDRKWADSSSDRKWPLKWEDDAENLCLEYDKNPILFLDIKPGKS